MIKVSNIRTQLLIEKIKEKIRPIILSEGGLGGHMSHIQDSNDLTFGDIKSIIHLASKGKLENVSEKLDGQNTFFTFDPVSGLRFARNTSHIKTGGMDGDDIEAKWGRTVPGVAKAFGDAYRFLSLVVSKLTPEERAEAFGPSGEIWYSAEILATSNPNVINYDKDSVVLHDSGTVYDENGRPTDADVSANFQKLSSMIDAVQASMSNESWQILSPIMVPLEKMSSNYARDRAITELERFMISYDMTNDNTAGDLVEEYVIEHYLKDLTADDDTKQYIAELIADHETAKDPGILQDLITEDLITPEDAAKIKPMMSMSFGAKLRTNLTEPLKVIIQNFAVEMLRGVKSLLVLNPNKEVQRLKDEVQNVITSLEASDVEKDKAFLAKQLGQLGGVDKITSSMEGLVFKYKGEVFKLTGGFSVANQLLGFFKYGR